MTKCLIPWSNIDIDAEGNIAPCCKFKFEGQTRQNITSDKINDYVDSDFLKDIKKEMNANIWPKGCVRCKTEEENNIKSKRQLDYERYTDAFDNYDESKGFITASIAYGNTCNYKCITCGPHASSRWRKEYKDIYNKDILPVEIVNENTVDDLQEHLKNIIHLDIPGGEPFLSEIKKQKKFLRQHIIDGTAGNISIHYTTNASVFPDPEWWEIWTHFKEIDIPLSVDGIFEKYEYIRYPGNWNLFNQNVNLYQIQEQKHNNIRLSVSHTVSAYNILYLPEFFDWCEQVKLPTPWCGKVHSPIHMRPTVYPNSIKAKIVAELQKSKHSDIPNWISLLETEDDSKYYELFRSSTARHDDYRGLKFGLVFPEVDQMMEQYKN